MNCRQIMSILLCGWVLWTGMTTGLTVLGSAARNSNWDILGTFETAAACEQEAHEMRDRFWEVIRKADPQARRGALAGVGGYMVTGLADGRPISTYYLCLPAATDPRPRYKE